MVKKEETRNGRAKRARGSGGFHWGEKNVYLIIGEGESLGNCGYPMLLGIMRIWHFDFI
jgi:hypothetical protein